MWRPCLLAAVIALGGCRGDTKGTSGTARLHVRLGDRAASGVAAVSHDDQGTILDSQASDTTGLVELGIDGGGLVSVLFGGDLPELVTTVVPGSGEVTIVGPPGASPPLVAGSLTITGAAPPPADGFDIVLGCLTVQRATMPASVDVIAPCLGTDLSVDVLVIARRAGAMIAYAAGRAPLESGIATFTVPAWSTALTPIPVTLDGVAPALQWTLYADGLPFYDRGELPAGLAVDRVELTADLAGARTILELPGPPAEVALGPADFLAPLAPSLAQDGARFTWKAPRLGDAVNLWATWPHAVWNVVLPPTTDHVTMPALALDTSGDVAAELRAVDSSDVAGFAALPAIHVEALTGPSTIAPVPADGAIRSASE